MGLMDRMHPTKYVLLVLHQNRGHQRKRSGLAHRIHIRSNSRAVDPDNFIKPVMTAAFIADCSIKLECQHSHNSSLRRSSISLPRQNSVLILVLSRLKVISSTPDGAFFLHTSFNKVPLQSFFHAC
ncbi:hypothetical protein ILYODFUR_023276 [Ilyodon furcidens]|uniref:Uncharacterized protein n=1 Tax=Ilyodon furcidens TaxID=33524 RepID=A0ABV0SZT7_9TELE